MAPPSAVERTSSESRCAGDSQTLKSLGSQASSSLALAASILRSCPLRDAIAILILLLSLPPTLVITVHTLFASLTFVPPAAGLSWNSWHSFYALGDWFHAMPGGGPSPFTIFFSDVLMTLVYLLLPLQIQTILLDLGQAVIAISLSGATAEKVSSSNSVALCSTIIGLSHILRHKPLHATVSDLGRSLLNNLGIDVPGASTSDNTLSSSTQLIPGWPRILLGCHILAQGILTLLRRSLAGVSRPQPVKKQDPEAASYSDAVKGSTGPAEGNPETPPNSSTDGRPPGPSPAVRDGKERVSNSKRKRKQANQVRSQQPLWAAIASTKVTFLKEMEQKQASTDALEAVSEDPSNSGLASVLMHEDRVWILDIRSTDVTFRADIIAFPTSANDSQMSEGAGPISAGIDKLKPFYVRLNGADWGSTRIVGAAADVEGANDQTDRIWNGEIYGLTPLTKYSCEFVKLSDQSVICSASLITLPAPSTEQSRSSSYVEPYSPMTNIPAVASAVAPPPQHQSLRPLSPTSTLKQSIASAEAKREEIRNKVKRSRKDQKTASSAVRREIDQLNSKVASSGGQDERQKQRILQLKQHVKQAEDATIALKADLDELGDVPEAEVEESASTRQVWEAACEEKAVVAAGFERAKDEANKEVSQLHAELASSAQKRERLNTRCVKLGEQFDRLVSEQHANLSARQRHEQERVRMREERAKNEEQLHYWISQSRIQAENLNIRANEYFQEADLMSNQLQRHQASISGPTTPEGNLPGTNGPLVQHAQGSDFQVFKFPPAQNSMTVPTWGGRARSSSMLSGYSGFTDDLDVPSTNGGAEGRKRSEGSSASTGSVGEDLATNSRSLAAKTMGPGPIGPPSASERARGKAFAFGSNNHR